MEAIVTAHDLSFKPFISEETIQEKIKELGERISSHYKSQRPVFLGVLNGAFIFAADLVRACNLDCEISFIKLSSYEGTKSTGEVKTSIGLEIDLKNKPVIIVEDIIDTGQTITAFLPVLQTFQPASIAIAALLVKPEALKHPLNIDFVGFEIPNKFVVGYGLDYNGLGRNLKSIYQLIE